MYKFSFPYSRSYTPRRSYSPQYSPRHSYYDDRYYKSYGGKGGRYSSRYNRSPMSSRRRHIGNRVSVKASCLLSLVRRDCNYSGNIVKLNQKLESLKFIVK